MGSTGTQLPRPWGLHCRVSGGRPSPRRTEGKVTSVPIKLPGSGPAQQGSTVGLCQLHGLSRQAEKLRPSSQPCMFLTNWAEMGKQSSQVCAFRFYGEKLEPHCPARQRRDAPSDRPAAGHPGRAGCPRTCLPQAGRSPPGSPAGSRRPSAEAWAPEVLLARPALGQTEAGAPQGQERAGGGERQHDVARTENHRPQQLARTWPGDPAGQGV